MAKQSSSPKVITKKHLARLERERRQTRLILAIAITGILAVVGLLGYGYLKLNVLDLREPVAEVNDVVITTGDWQERVRFQRVQMMNAYSQYAFYQQSFGFDYSQQMQQIESMLGQPEIIGQQALDQMRDEILIRQEAESRGITVSEEEINSLFQENFDFFPSGSPTPTVTPTEFSFPTLTTQQLTIYPSTSTPTTAPTSTAEPTSTPDPALTSTPTATAMPPTPTPVPELPTATPTPYTLEGFQEDYQTLIENYAADGVSEKTIRAVYEADLYRRKLLAELTKDIPQTEEQVWARHILLATETEAKAAYSLLQQGADFAQLARTSSEDTGSGASGGDLGWFGKGAMVPEFESAAYSLEVGEISEPVKSDFGYHIIQVLGHQELPLDATQLEQKKDTIFNDWLTAAREEATITTFDIWKERVPMEPTLQVPVQ
jgi:parvulin-like peptidyl-prolyl isomerase